jgi:uncharacterized SAM-binding protein YcdF (DUF218 family)
MKNWFDRTLQICGVIFIIQMCFVIIISFFAMTNPEGITSVLAKHLIKEDALVKSDAIVVLGGFENEKRFNYGIELYKQGYGNKMIVSGAGDTGDIIEYMTSNAVEKEDILIDQYATTTYENAVYVKKLVDDNHIKSFILVTSPDESKRVRLAFDKVFGNSGIRILSSSNKDSEFKPGKIMNSKNAKQQLIIEWMKLLSDKTK